MSIKNEVTGSELRKIQISEPMLGEEEWLAIKEPLFSGWVTQGPKVRAFEEEFASRHQVKHAVAVTSCTTGLHLALLALDIGPGDEVIVPSFTWIATANAVLYCGATPVFVDIDISSFNIDVEKVKDKVNQKTKAIIAVHLFGLCADMDALKDVANGIPIIEDAACAAGASYDSVPAGGLGELACFSFHPRKSITCGEGGMITTQSDELAEKIIKLRNHGAEVSEEVRHLGPKPYLLPDFNVLGYNYRMTDLQGAVGRVQLSKLDGFIEEREKWAKYYIGELEAIEWLATPQFSAKYKHGWQSFVVLVKESISPGTRNEIMETLQEKGISTRPGTHAIHMLNFYRDKFGMANDDFEYSKLANDCSMAIPLHNKMDKEDFEYIVDALKSL